MIPAEAQHRATQDGRAPFKSGHTERGNQSFSPSSFRLNSALARAGFNSAVGRNVTGGQALLIERGITMKKLFVISALIVAASTGLIAPRVGRAHVPRTLTIKVTSADPNQQVFFDASYIFQSGDSQLQHVEQVTPFEVSASSDFVAGIFRNKSNSGQMVVQLLSSTGDESKKLGNAGRADVVVLDTTGGGEFPYSIQGFSAR